MGQRRYIYLRRERQPQLYRQYERRASIPAPRPRSLVTKCRRQFCIHLKRNTKFKSKSSQMKNLNFCFLKDDRTHWFDIIQFDRTFLQWRNIPNKQSCDRKFRVGDADWINYIPLDWRCGRNIGVRLSSKADTENVTGYFWPHDSFYVFQL